MNLKLFLMKIIVLMDSIIKLHIVNGFWLMFQVSLIFTKIISLKKIIFLSILTMVIHLFLFPNCNKFYS